MNGNLDTSDVLLNRGLNGSYYGYSGSQGNGFGNFPGDGSAVKEAVRGNRDIALLESVNKSTAEQFLSSQIRQHNDNISERISTSQDSLARQISDQNAEFRFANITQQHASLERMQISNQAALLAALTANKADTDRQLHALELKQVECCCELKAGQATIIANQESHRLAQVESENQNLRTQIMINNQGRINGGQGNG